MQHHHGPEALDCTLRDLFKQDGQHIDQVPLFGGITVIFVGDFMQTLPIVQRASRVQIINASLYKSRLWRHVHVLHLTQNMCLDCTPESDAFTQWLLTIGTGSPLPPDKSIQLPQNMSLPHNDINQGNLEDQFFLKHTILSSKNDTVDQLNQLILDRYVSLLYTSWLSMSSLLYCP